MDANIAKLFRLRKPGGGKILHSHNYKNGQHERYSCRSLASTGQSVLTALTAHVRNAAISRLAMMPLDAIASHFAIPLAGMIHSVCRAGLYVIRRLQAHVNKIGEIGWNAMTTIKPVLRAKHIKIISTAWIAKIAKTA